MAFGFLAKGPSTFRSGTLNSNPWHLSYPQLPSRWFSPTSHSNSSTRVIEGITKPIGDLITIEHVTQTQSTLQAARFVFRPTSMRNSWTTSGSGQGEFAKWKQIVDDIIEFHEVLHLVKENKEQAFVLKLDMQKVYDRVNWTFLDKIIDKFGFEGKWRRWIQECIVTPTFLIITNGEPTRFFKSSRGIRQGEQISPYLFIIMV